MTSLAPNASPWTSGDWSLAALLVLAVGCVYAPLLGHGFLTLDDPFFVSENPALASGLSAEGFRWAFTSVHAANWMPLTWISYLADETLHGRSPAGVLAANVLLHGTSTLLLFAALRRLTRQAIPSAVVAAVFAVHPLQVEVVAWASERKGALSGLCWMLAMWIYAGAGDPLSRRRQAALAGAMGAALLAKTVAVTLPFALLLLDYWPRRRLTKEDGRLDAARTGEALREKIPLFVLTPFGCCVAFFAQGQGGAIADFDSVSLGERLANALAAYPAYLGTFFWPQELAVYYPFRSDLGWLEIGFSGALLVGITTLAVVERHRRPWLLVGWLWFLGVLVPMLGLVQIGGQARADRYLHLPAIGLTLACVWTAADWANTRRRQRAMGAAATIAVLALSVAATEQRALWRDGVSLFQHTLRVSGSHPLIHEHLGLSLLGAQRVEAGREQLEQALAFRPNLVLANNLAWSYATAPERSLHRPERALALARANVAAAGPMPELLDTLAAALAAHGQYDEAAATQRRAIRLAREANAAALASILETRLGAYTARRPFLDRHQAWAGGDAP